VVDVDVWVQSCRAFSRRIEHHVLSRLFASHGVTEIRLAFAPTGRNAAITEFLGSLLCEPPAGPVSLGLAAFVAHAPPLVHRMQGWGP
jgi:hypothetical protein